MAVTVSVTPVGLGEVTVRIQAADTTWTTLHSLDRTDPWGRTQRVRGAAGALLGAGVAVIPDAEFPLDVDVTYSATVTKASGSSIISETGTVVYHTTTDKQSRSFLQDADNASTQISPNVEGVESISRLSRLGIFEVIGRATPVVTTAKLAARRGTLALLTTTQNETDALWRMIDSGNLLLFRTTRTYGIGSLYFACESITEERVTRLGMIGKRRFEIEFVETDPPVGPAIAYSWNNWTRVVNNSATWQTTLNARSTWELLLTNPLGVTPVPGG